MLFFFFISSCFVVELFYVNKGFGGIISNFVWSRSVMYENCRRIRRIIFM